MNVYFFELFLVFLSLLLSKFVDHPKLSILLSHEFFGELEVAL